MAYWVSNFGFLLVILPAGIWKKIDSRTTLVRSSSQKIILHKTAIYLWGGKNIPSNCISSSKVVGNASRSCSHSCWISHADRISVLGMYGRSLSVHVGSVRAAAIIAPSTNGSTSSAAASVYTCFCLRIRIQFRLSEQCQGHVILIAKKR